MEKTEKNALVIVDPQNDFCDRQGSLYVEGAEEDVKRLAGHLSRHGKAYSDVFVSLDSHDAAAAFHPRFWVDDDSRHPEPYTQITPDDFMFGKWKTVAPENGEPMAQTFRVLREKRLALTIWPEHCVLSTWGHQIAAPLLDALNSWRTASGHAVRYVLKGENPYTDQFSIFEGVVDSWPETAFNESLFERLKNCDSVTFAGEALSHCVKESVLSYLDRLGKGTQEVRLLVDCASPVNGFDREESLQALASAGVACVASAQ